MRLILLLILVVAIGCNQQAVTNNGNDEPVFVKKLAPKGSQKLIKKLEGNNIFALKLYNILAHNKEENIFFSPNSISTALAMTYAGAKGNTAKEMKETLHFTLDDKELHNAFSALLDHLNGKEKKRGYELRIANRLWGQKNYTFLPEFVKITRDNYGAPIEQLDFVNNTEGARQRINTWVEERTEQKIKNLIAKGILSANTRLVLTNAIYFKGDWKTQFKKANTKKKPFYVTDTKEVQVDMMFQKKKCNYYERRRQFKVLQLQYKGEEVSIFFFLPHKKYGMKKLEAFLNMGELNNIRASMADEKVRVSIPKFKMEYKFTANESLKKLGMKDAFSRKADFSGMNGNKELYISKVVHKAFIKVNEEGTEAAAATGVVMSRKSISRVEEFNANRPFIFLIQDNKTGALLFMGKLVNPTK